MYLDESSRVNEANKEIFSLSKKYRK
jgi:hypothetical protein